MYIVSSNKKRLVTAKSTLPKKINELEIICKVRKRGREGEGGGRREGGGRGEGGGGREGESYTFIILFFQDLRKVVFSFKSCSKSDVVHVSITILYCTALYYTVLYCTVLYCTVLYCTVLYCTVLYCTCTCMYLYCVYTHSLPCQ